MPHNQRVLYGLVLAALLIVTLIPSMLPGALANNLWSIRAIKRIFSDQHTSWQLPPSPPYHPHGDIWIRRFALEQAHLQRDMTADGDFEDKVTVASANRWVDSITNYRELQSLDVRAEYFYQGGAYLEAIKTWKSIGNVSALEEVASEATAYGITTLATLAYQAAYEIDSLRYALPLARTLQDNGEDDRAITLLESAVQKYPFATQREKWMSQISLIYRSQTAWDQAELTYQCLLIENPTSLDGWIGLGWLSYERDQAPEEALAHFEKAIAFKPQSADGYAAMGSLYASQGHYQLSSDWYRQALARDRANPNFRLSYADAMESAGLIEQAIAAYQALITQFPSFDPAYVRLARVYLDSGQPDQAIMAIETALALTDVPQRAYYVRAAQIFKDNHLSTKAQEVYYSGELAFESIIERYPIFPEPYVQLASFYEDFDQIDQAITAIETALDLMRFPNTKIYLQAGRLYEQAGLTDQALAAYRAVLVADSKNTTALQGLRRLSGGD